MDTPKASPFKLKLDEQSGRFRVHKALPLGLEFPFNFGYVPSTRGEDGDALDVLLLANFIFPVGAIVLVKLVAVLEATQVEGRKRNRNDRLLAIPVEMASREPMLPTIKLDAPLKKAIIDFFIKYNELQGRVFQPHRYASPRRALILIRKANAIWLAEHAERSRNQE